MMDQGIRNVSAVSDGLDFDNGVRTGFPAHPEAYGAGHRSDIAANTDWANFEPKRAQTRTRKAIYVIMVPTADPSRARTPPHRQGPP